MHVLHQTADLSDSVFKRSRIVAPRELGLPPAQNCRSAIGPPYCVSLSKGVARWSAGGHGDVRIWFVLHVT